MLQILISRCPDAFRFIYMIWSLRFLEKVLREIPTQSRRMCKRIPKILKQEASKPHISERAKCLMLAWVGEPTLSLNSAVTHEKREVSKAGQFLISYKKFWGKCCDFTSGIGRAFSWKVEDWVSNAFSTCCQSRSARWDSTSGASGNLYGSPVELFHFP